MNKRRHRENNVMKSIVKKAILIVISLLLVLSLASCGSTEEPEDEICGRWFGYTYYISWNGDSGKIIPLTTAIVEIHNDGVMLITSLKDNSCVEWSWHRIDDDRISVESNDNSNAVSKVRWESLDDDYRHDSFIRLYNDAARALGERKLSAIDIPEGEKEIDFQIPKIYPFIDESTYFAGINAESCKAVFED